MSRAKSENLVMIARLAAVLLCAALGWASGQVHAPAARQCPDPARFADVTKRLSCDYDIEGALEAEDLVEVRRISPDLSDCCGRSNPMKSTIWPPRATFVFLMTSPSSQCRLTRSAF